MFYRITIGLFFLLSIFFLFFACKPEENPDTIAPVLMESTPVDGAVSIDLNTIIKLQFTEKIVLSSNALILLNNELVTASATARTLTINATLLPNTSYTLLIPNTAVRDVAGNFIKEITITFTTANSINPEGTVFEAESATLSAGASVATTLTNYSGTGYINTNAGNVTFTINAELAGYYDLKFRYSTSGSQKQNDLYVDGTKLSSLVFEAVNVWTIINAGKIKLTAGQHSIAIVKNWGYIQLDNMTVTYDANGLDPFNIDAALVTPSPSAQAVKLYDFLKDNFGTKIISGTMAKHSTNIDEATWVYNQTGKWPALTGFDFIDHTYPDQNWVKYSAPFTLGQDWWNNNGIVSLIWHWRDPLTKSGAFYTADTNFDISKVTDTASVEYKAMIVDIDKISGYLKQFKDAGIPVVWRPLHEASGGWFWWGAKGAAPCKALWILMFDRMVNYHGLNNLIWVWTSDVSTDAPNWYPGDAYVDVIGMDIYPGENQHGSQYISFNKIKDIFGGKKLITLSECGSVPDPSSMKEYGDMWSWFMPWNGVYTESEIHNGAVWWNKFFSYDYVFTRDKMPDLK